MEKTLTIGAQTLKFRASARLPRLYRYKTNRDLIVDLQRLKKSFADASSDAEKQLAALDLQIFEDLAFCMAKLADPTIPDTADEWLDTIDGTFSVYAIFPELLSLWAENSQTTVEPKKNKE